MRRALLTAKGVTAVPVSVGNTGTFGTSNFGDARTAVDLTDLATATSTVTNVAVNCNSAGTIYAMVGSLSGSTFTVRSISGPLSAAVGLNNFSVSLAVVAGDRIGYWTPSGTAAIGRYTSGEFGYDSGFNLSSPGSAPTPGATIALSTFANTRLSMLGIG